MVIVVVVHLLQNESARLFDSEVHLRAGQRRPFEAEVPHSRLAFAQSFNGFVTIIDDEKLRSGVGLTREISQGLPDEMRTIARRHDARDQLGFQRVGWGATDSFPG